MGRPTYHLEHGVASITFPPGQEDGPCECNCGGWSGLASGFGAHVKEAGRQRKHNRWVKQQGTPEWNRTMNPEAAARRQAEAAA